MSGNDAAFLQRLVDGLIAGDDDSWREFLRMAGPVIISACRRSGLDRDETDDIAQQVVLKLLDRDCRTLRKLVITTEVAFFGWIKVVVSRTVLDHIRRTEFRRELETNWAFDRWRDELDASGVSDRAEQAILMETAVKGLSKSEQTLFWLDNQGLMDREIAGILGTSLTTVQQRLTRLRHKIKSIMTGEDQRKAEKT